MAQVVLRRAELDDQQAITRLIGKNSSSLRQRFGRFNVVSLVETSFLSVVALDDAGEVVGFACFEDGPNMEEGAEAFFGWLAENVAGGGGERYSGMNTLFLTFFVALEKAEEEVSEFTLRTAFTTLPHIDYALCLMPADAEPAAPLTFAFDSLDTGASAEDTEGAAAAFSGMRVFATERELLVPSLKIRVARVEDHDDLVPIFDAQSEVLTARYGEFFLAEMIQAQDSRNVALVSVVADVAVGLMSLSSEMDMGVLQQCFELEPFDNLEKVVGEAELASAAAEADAAAAAAVSAAADAVRAINPRVAVVGPPCSGRTALSEALAEHYGCALITPAALVAAAVAEPDSELGKRATAGPVDDALLADLVKAALGAEGVSASGAILDGFPANKAQADALVAADFAPDMVLCIEAEDEALAARAAARAGADDGEEAFATRLAADREGAPDMYAMFMEASLLSRLEGEGSAARVLAAAKQAVEIVAPIEVTAPAAAAAAAGGGASAADGAGECNAFAVTLFCLDEVHDSRACDFLEHAFAQFPERDYCLLTLPPTSPESVLLSSFSQVPPRATSAFSHVLYIVHRAALLAALPQALVVRRAGEGDFPRVAKLLESMAEDGKALKDDVKASESELAVAVGDNPTVVTFVAEIAKQIVAVAVLDRAYSSTDEINWIKARYHVDDFVLFKEHRARNQAFLKHFAINPIFQRSSRAVLQHAMRLYRKSMVYLRSYPGAPVPSVLPELVAVKPRQLAQPAPGTPAPPPTKVEADGPFALSFLTHKLLSEPKIVNNARILVVGASTTSFACLETLLMVPYIHFTSVTLLAPGGLQREASPAADAMPASASDYGAEELKQLGVGSRVRVVDGRLAALDRDSRCAILEGGSCIPYDYLVLGAGLQDATARRLGFSPVRARDAPLPPPAAAGGGGGSAAALPPALEGSVFFLQGRGEVEALCAAVEANVAQSTVVYGAGLEAVCAVTGLLKRKMRPSRITLVRPAPAPSGGSWLGNAEIDATVEEQLTSLGVTVLHGHTIERVQAGGKGDRLSAAVFTSAADGAPKVLKCTLLGCADTPNVDTGVFSAVNSAELVYDGRLVVDLRFATVDPSVYAAGPLCKFSRRFKHALPHEKFNSREVGTRLAESLLQIVDPLSAEPEEPSEVPHFRQSRSRHAVLPGGQHYVHVSLPQVPPGCRELVTKREDDDGGEYFWCVPPAQ